MSDLDISMLSKGLLAESWHVALNDYIIDLAWCPDASKLAAATVEGSVFMIDDHGDSAHFELIGQHAGGANSLSWRCDGAEFATAGHDGLVKIWNGSSGRQLSSLEAGDSWVAKVAYSPCSDVLATAAGRHLKLWNEQREVFYESSDHSSTIADVGWNPSGLSIAVAAYNGITLHVPGEQSPPRKYNWKGSSLVLAWSPDAKYMATGEQDSTVHFWHVESGRDAQMWGFPTKVLALSWDSSGRWLATGGGASVCLWDCSGKGPAGRKPRQYDAHSSKLTQLAFQPDGKLLVSADAEAFLMLWDPIKHDKIIGGVLLSSSASCLRWCEGGKLAVGQQDGKVVVFQVQSVAGKIAA
ncbi:MAG: WD40 repeat domain-containing protein [Thermoanaerobaculia bacterium]|nr:WD40 repeat domain-containing protein [Thermoanaerobaculia bacterium]